MRQREQTTTFEMRLEIGEQAAAGAIFGQTVQRQQTKMVYFSRRMCLNSTSIR